MWILFACLSAFFAGITSILAKCGINKTNSTVATAVRTIVVLIFAWLMVFIVGSQGNITNLSSKSLIFIGLSGIATGASWLCYFKALSIGEVNKVVPIDKLSTPLGIVLAFIILGESFSFLKAVSVALITVGIFLMISKSKSLQKDDENNSTNENNTKKSKSWLIFALLSAVFAALTSILAKIGIENVETNLATAIRTVVVLIMAWVCVFVSNNNKNVLKIEKKELIFILLSGVATGASWVCYYKAIADGILSAVIPIDKLSIIVTIIFSKVVFGEKLNLKSAIGLVFMIIGTLLLVML